MTFDIIIHFPSAGEERVAVPPPNGSEGTLEQLRGEDRYFYLQPLSL